MQARSYLKSRFTRYFGYAPFPAERGEFVITRSADKIASVMDTWEKYIDVAAKFDRIRKVRD